MNPAEERILILAPTGRDAELLTHAVQKGGFTGHACLTAEDLLREASLTVGTILITEEGVTPEVASGLGRLGDEQPAWSDLPVLLITSDARRPSTPTAHLMKVAGNRGNVTLLERPLRIDTLLSTVGTALRSRRRQYEIRNYLNERTRNEERLRETQKLESIGVLAGGIAHDFNNLLTGILGNASLCQDMIENNPELQVPLDEVIQAGKRAADLTAQLLAYAGKGRFVIGPIDLSVLAQEILPLVKTFIPKSVEVETALVRELPLTNGDNSQIQQVLMNLVINAAEAFPGEETGKIRITTGVRQLHGGSPDGTFPVEEPESGTYVFVEVNDNGSGMPEEVRQRIFDPFYTTKFQGRGLGLSAVLGIVRSHRGALQLLSTPGQGSTFTVYFPVAAIVPRTQEKTGRLPSGDMNGTVLVVDDEPTVRSVAIHALRRSGMTVLWAPDGVEALRLFTLNFSNIDLVILDLTMPLMGGVETYDAIRRLSIDVPVILSSGYSESLFQERFAEKGFACFLEKPYTAGQLLEKVKGVLIHKEQRNALSDR